MDPYLQKKDWRRGPCLLGRVPCEARNRYGTLAFAPFALCGCEHRTVGLFRVGRSSGRGRKRLVCPIPFSLSVIPSRLFALACGPFCRRYRSVTTGASVCKQNSSSIGSSWSATASRPTSGCDRWSGFVMIPFFASVAQPHSLARGHLSGSERSTRNWYGPGESDCLLSSYPRISAI